MNRLASFALCLGLLIGMVFSASALDVTVSPTSIAWSEQRWVDITVSNVPPGGKIELDLHVDADANQQVGSNDVLLIHFTLQDGVTNALGATVMPDDNDGPANGIITTRIPYFGSSDGFPLMRGVGNHIWRATVVSGGDVATARFEVTQPITPTWVSGQVVDAATSNGVGGAYVETGLFADHRGSVPGCWTDTNGVFRLQIPDGFPLDNLADIWTMKPGCFMRDEAQDGSGFSGLAFSNDLVIGANALPKPLYLVQQPSGEYFRLSGHIYDEATNALPGVLLFADSEDEFGWGLGVTDTNGFYELFMPTGSVFEVFVLSEFVNLRGLMGTGIDAIAMTADQENVDLYCPRATALARGSVTDAVTGQPLVGVLVEYEYENGYYGVAATLSDGFYEQGIVEGVGSAFVEEGLGLAGYPSEDSVAGFENISLPGSGVFTNANFVVIPGYVLSGHVYDTSTNALAGGFVEAREPADGDWMGGCDVNRQGYYEICLSTGNYRIATWEYHELGYLNMAYSNYFTWDNWNHDPVTVTSNGASGIDLYLPPAAYIRGVVLGDSEPVAGADVSAFLVVENEDGNTDRIWHGNATSGDDGNYEIAVPPGTNYIVQASVYDVGSYWLRQLYDGTSDDDNAIRVSTEIATPATNINFNLQKGGTISGHVYAEDGITPVVNCHVYTEDFITGAWSDGDNTDNNGFYSLLVPSGAYKLRAYPSENGQAFIDEWYDDVLNGNDATQVMVTASNGTAGIDFILSAGGTISGHVFAEDGATPIADCHVYAEDFNTGAWSGGGNTDSNGYYSLRVAAGAYRVQAVPSNNGQAFVDEWFGDVLDRNDATQVMVTTSNDTSGIDFALGSGGTISGHVLAEDGATPIADCHVYAEDINTGAWSGGGNTDSNGYYSLRVAAGPYRVRAVPSNNGHAFVDEWYDDVLDRNDATQVMVTTSNDTASIDFILETGGTISGHVFAEDGATPIADCHVYAEDFNTGAWSGGGNTDSNGYYSLRVAAGAYRVQAVPSNNGHAFVDEWYDDVLDRNDATQVMVTTSNDTASIDFVLGSGGTISGHVFAEDGVTPVANCTVFANDFVSNNGRGDASTDGQGAYSIRVPAGDYRVRADPSDTGLRYVSHFFNGVVDYDLAARVTVTTSNNTDGIDFELPAAGTISGVVMAPDGVAPVANCHVGAEDAVTGNWITGVNTAGDGSYTLVVTGGTYRVAAHPSNNGLPFVNMYYSNVLARADATEVLVVGTNDTSSIDFILNSGGTISGHVLAEDGTTPIAGCHVYAEDFNTGAWSGGGNTDSNGYYSLRVAAGAYRVQAVPSNNGQAFIDEWYDDVLDRNDATQVMVAASNDTASIDFVLSSGSTLSGYVYAEDGITPIANCEVQLQGTNHFNTLFSTRTASNGAYTLRGSPDWYCVRAVPEQTADQRHAPQWYSNAYWSSDALALQLEESINLSNVVFVLREGAEITGHVYDQTGMHPLPNCYVQAGRLHPENNYLDVTVAGRTDADGRYRLVVPEATNLIVKTGAFTHSGMLWADQFFENTYDLYSATILSPSWSGTISNINFTLHPDILSPADPLDIAITNGIAWLASIQQPGGQWGTRYPVAKTALSVLVLETHAWDSGYASPLDPAYPYHTNIVNGLHFLFENAHTRSIGMQSAGNPDGDLDGLGIYFTPDSFRQHGNQETYSSSIALMAIAASRAPTNVVSAVGSPVNGWTYARVVQNAVDHLAWGQTDSGLGRGGWNYSAANNSGDRGDQSNSGWVSLGLAYAEQCMGIDPPGFVRNEMNTWVEQIRLQDTLNYFSYGGANYDPSTGGMPDTNPLRTGNLLQQMEFLGDSTSTPRVVAALTNMQRNWDPRIMTSGSNGRPLCYHTTYAVMKGLEAFNIERLGTVDWFADMTNAILNQQTSEGWWQDWNYDDGERILSTTWALLTLQTAVVFNQPPVPVVDVSPTNGPSPLRVTFDFMNAYDPDGRIVRCEIDKEGDGAYETTLDERGSVIIEYPRPGLYESIVRVTDNVGATGSTSIHVTVWGTAPEASIQADQETGSAPLIVTLDASASYAAPGSQLVSYAWDLTGNGTFDSLSSAPTMVWTYRLPGTYHATVSVMDDQGLRDSAAVTITVSAPPIPVPEVNLTATPLYGYLPMKATFSAIVTNVAEIAEYRWDFDGNGTDDRITTTGVVSHVYQQAGTYAAGVTVLSTNGLSTNATVSINVRESSQYRVWISKPPQENETPRPVWGDAVSLIGHVAPANATVSVQFEYSLAVASGAWQPVGSPVYPQPRAYQTTWDTTGLLDGSNYNLRAVATLDTDETVVSETYTVLVSSNAENLPRGIAEWAATADKPHGQKQSVDPKATTVSDLHDGTSVMIPAECISSETASVLVQIVGTDTNGAAGAALGKASVGANRKVSISGAPALGKPITIIIPYPDEDNDGIVDGTAIPERTIEAFWFDTVSGTWKKPMSTDVNTKDNQVKIKTYHLTEFGLWGSRNLLNPDYGGVLLTFSSEAAPTTSAANLTDGNTVSYWKSAPNPDTQEFVYAFTNHMSAIFNRVVIRNYSETSVGMTNYSAGFSVHTAMDGTDFSPIYGGVLAPTDSPQTFAFGVVTGRQVKLVISSGVHSQAWAMAEFEAHGELTVDANTNGIPDWWEWRFFGHYHVNPDADTDGDELDNRLEFEHGGNPTNACTDGDGIPDGWKIRYGFRIGDNVATLDSNNDGHSNWEAYVAGIDPTNVNSRFVLSEPELGTSLVFHWDSLTGRRYKIFARTNLLTGVWEIIHEASGNGTQGSFTNDLDSPRRYYRIGVELE